MTDAEKERIQHASYDKICNYFDDQADFQASVNELEEILYQILWVLCAFISLFLAAHIMLTGNRKNHPAPLIALQCVFQSIMNFSTFGLNYMCPFYLPYLGAWTNFKTIKNRLHLESFAP